MNRALALVQGLRGFIQAVGGVWVTLSSLVFLIPEGLLQGIEENIERRIRIRGDREKLRSLDFQKWNMLGLAKRLGAKGPEEIRGFLIYQRLHARMTPKSVLHDLPDEWWSSLERAVLAAA
jgi:hypothetical protein